MIKQGYLITRTPSYGETGFNKKEINYETINARWKYSRRFKPE